MPNTLSDETLAEVIKCPVNLLKTMKEYKELSVSNRIIFAVERKDTSLPWTDVTLRERAKQEVELEQKRLERLARLERMEKHEND